MICSIATRTIDTLSLARLRLVGPLSALLTSRRSSCGGVLARRTHSFTVVLRLGARFPVSGLSLRTGCTVLASCVVLGTEGCWGCLSLYSLLIGKIPYSKLCAESFISSAVSRLDKYLIVQFRE